MANTDFQLGLSVNLIAGLNPAWDPRAGRLNILYPSKEQAMALSSPEPMVARGEWTFPEITLHETALGLLDELIPYEIVNPASFTDAPVIGAGALLAGAANSQASLEALSKAIGVNLADPTLRYALVKLTRIDGASSHASAASGILVHARPRQPDAAYGLNPEFVRASIQTRFAGQARQQDYGEAWNTDVANNVLSSFATYGTHYVCAVELGDTIVQVFAYAAAQFEVIKQAYAGGGNVLSGPGSQHFAQFTTDLSSGRFGFVSQYGHVLSLSHSQGFAASLQKGEWKDSLWSHKDSVFAPFNANATLPWWMLQEKFTEQVVIGVQLATLSVMYEQKRGLIWQRIFKGAMAQKYRTSINPNFEIYDKRDFVGMLPEDQTGIVSEIATPFINVYKTRIDLAKMQFVAAAEVKEFTLLANVLSVDTAAAVNLPGGAVRLFGQVMDMRAKGRARAVVVADGAFGSVEIACDEFLGALSIQDQSGTHYHVIVDGLMFGLDGSGPDAVPVVREDVRGVPPVASLPILTDNIQFSMAFAEAVISDQSACPTDSIQAFARRYLTWLTDFIPPTVTDPGLLALRVRALDLAKYASDPSYGSFVPILPSDAYDKLIQSILDYLGRIQTQIAQNEQKLAIRRLEERVIDVGKTLNQNIIASGKLISGVIDVNAAQQNDLVNYYDGIVAQQKAEAAKQQASIDSLQASLMQAQADVNYAQQVYKSAVQKWQTMEGIKLALDIATNLFSLGTSIAIPASSIGAVKELGLMAQRIQKTLNVLNAASKLYTGASTGIGNLTGAQDALDGLDEARFGQMSALSWDELSIKFTVVMATGPDVKAEKAALQAAFNTMVLRGKAVASAQSSLHSIRRDIYNNQQQKAINQRQADRFAALQSKLDPANVQDLDKDGIDLMGLTGYLSFLQHQMLTILAKAFLQKDLALQYANLQPATPVTSFSLLRFSSAIVQQNAATITALTALSQYQAATTHPIDYVIAGIAPSQLTDGNVHNATIYLDAPQFMPYVDARVVAVLATVDGIASTDGGTYALKVVYDGMPFQDRDLQRDTLNFHTVSRERVYIYDAKTHAPNFTDKGDSWSRGVSRITPFSQWSISLPATNMNKGIKFNEDRLTIRLSFVLEARIIDPAKALEASLARRLGAGAAESFLAEIAPLTRGAAEPFALPSSAQLIAQMFAQGSVTNNWDVVFNMALLEINKALKDQYEALKKDPKFTNQIKISTSERYPGVTVITKFEVNYGYPLMTFSINSGNSVQLDLLILQGTIQKCSKFGDNPEVCDPPQSLSGQKMIAIVDLAKVGGVVNVDGQSHEVLQVRLDMAQGAFSISNIQLSDAQKVELNAAIKAHFVNNPVSFLINQLDLTNVPTLEGLKPHGFLFKTLQTPSGNQMLQLFIMTGKRPLLNQTQAFLNNLPEPLPLASSTSMFIRSGLVFKDVLPPSITNEGWALEGANPGATDKAWSAKFTRANVMATVDLSQLNHTSTSSSEYGSSSITYTYSIPGGNNVSWSLAGTTLVCQESGQMLFSGNQKQTFNYNERSCSSYAPCFFNCDPKCSDTTRSTDIAILVSAPLALSVGGGGREQTILIKTSAAGASAQGHLSGGGPSGSDNLAAQVNQRIRDQVPPQIERNLKFNFNAISVFALKNLLFPANNYILFRECGVPGDLLLLGNFEK
jgi:hypothetical protein